MSKRIKIKKNKTKNIKLTDAKVMMSVYHHRLTIIYNLGYEFFMSFFFIKKYFYSFLIPYFDSIF